jgi:serine/threonine protein kinase
VNEIRELLLRGDRVAAIAVLRRLASDGALESVETAADLGDRSASASLKVWEETLRRLEHRGVFSQTIPSPELAALVRAAVAECVRDAIAAESRQLRHRDAARPTFGSGGIEAAPPETAPMATESRFESVGDGGATPCGERSASRMQPLPLRIGNYIVIRELDAGGFGKVYQAVSDDDLRLPVAIKVMHEAGEEQVRRFIAERAILANLRHPHIARFESSGNLDDGRPWIAMEYIEGLPLVRYCERERLSTESRLKLFQKICDAVHEAHKWGVIHLDIKPSNIMVTLEGEPKLLDFGIAKVLRSLDPSTRSTSGRGSLTYLYSSPEQLRNEPVSTASDVYNLGLVLYELLTGSRARQSAAKEIDVFIREVLARDPEPPSKRVARLAEPHPISDVLDAASSAATASATSATTSQGGAARLVRKLRGDLDTIVLMSMRIEPSRRYSSAKELAEDVGRHLERLPIVARKSSVGYGLGMLLLRHRRLVAAALLVLVTSVAVAAAVWSERERRAQAGLIARDAEIDAQRDLILAMETEARAARREAERARDRRYGWVRIDLDLDPEVRGLLESRVADERRIFDLLVKLAETDASQPFGIEQVRDLVEPELKLVSLRRRSRDPGEVGEALRCLEALEGRLKRVPAETIGQTESAGLSARILETRSELLGPRTPEGKRAAEEALVLRRKLLELRGSDTQSRYDYAKLLQRFCEAAIAEQDGATALRLAEEMLAMRESVLSDERLAGDLAVADRRERDVALAHFWRCRAALASADLAVAERAASECHRIMAERFARPNRRDLEAEVDLARALDDRLTVALQMGDAESASQLSADAARHGLSAAVRAIESAPELVQAIEFVSRRLQILLAAGADELARDAETFARTAIEQLENAHKANQRSVLRSDKAIAERIERIHLLMAAAQSAQAKVADALLTVASLGLAKLDPSELQAAARARSVWIVGIVLGRDAIARGQTDEARAWVDFSARAAVMRNSRLEARICLNALDAIAHDSAAVRVAEGSPHLVALRALGGDTAPPQARAVPTGPTNATGAFAPDGS